MKGKICPYSAGAEYYFEEGCYITELSNSADDPEVSIARVRVESGMTTRLHQLRGVTERYVMLEGEGVVELGGQSPREVGPGDVVLIPPLCQQRIANRGSDELIFLALCTPRFTRDCYEDLELETDPNTDTAARSSA